MDADELAVHVFGGEEAGVEEVLGGDARAGDGAEFLVAAVVGGGQEGKDWKCQENLKKICTEFNKKDNL